MSDHEPARYDVDPAEEDAWLEAYARKTKRTVQEVRDIMVRMTTPGVAVIGGKVIWDGEALAGGLTPLTTWPEPDSTTDVDYPEDEDTEQPPPVAGGKR